MTINTSQLPPGVYTSETDEAIVLNYATTTGASIAVRTLQGATNPQLVTSASQFNALYGEFLGLTVSPSLFCAEDYLNLGTQLYTTRVILSGDQYAWNVYNNSTGWLNPTVQSAPSSYSWASGDAFQITSIGPGAYYNGISISIVENTGSNTPYPTYSLSVINSSNSVLEVWTVSFANNKNTAGVNTFAPQVINGNSLYVTIKVNPAFTDGILNPINELSTYSSLNSAPTLLTGVGAGTANPTTNLDNYSSCSSDLGFYIFGGQFDSTVGGDTITVYSTALINYNNAQNIWSTVALTDNVLNAVLVSPPDSAVSVFNDGTLFYFNNSVYWYGTWQYAVDGEIPVQTAIPMLVEIDLITSSINYLSLTGTGSVASFACTEEVSVFNNQDLYGSQVYFVGGKTPSWAASAKVATTSYIINVDTLACTASAALPVASSYNYSEAVWSNYDQAFILAGGRTALAPDLHMYSYNAFAGTFNTLGSISTSMQGASLYNIDYNTIYLLSNKANYSSATTSLYQFDVTTNTFEVLQTNYEGTNVADNGFISNNLFDSLALVSISVISNLATPTLYSNSSSLSQQNNLVLGANDPVGIPSDSDVINAYTKMSDTKQYPYSLILNAGWVDIGVQKFLQNQALVRKQTFVILDGDENYQYTAQSVVNYRDSLNIDADNCGLYAPFQYVRYSTAEGQQVLVYFSGLIANQMVYNDTVSYVWKAVAGPNRGILNQVISLPPANGDTSQIGGSYTAINYTDGDQALMYNHQVNPIIRQPGYGIMINGNRTLSSTPIITVYENVRRSVNYIELTCKSIANAYQFEDNDTSTQTALASAENSFLATVAAQGGLYNYSVVCDSTNNTPAIVAQGILLCNIGLQPSISAEWIELVFAIELPTSAGVI